MALHWRCSWFWIALLFTFSPAEHVSSDVQATIPIIRKERGAAFVAIESGGSVSSAGMPNDSQLRVEDPELAPLRGRVFERFPDDANVIAHGLLDETASSADGATEEELRDLLAIHGFARSVEEAYRLAAKLLSRYDLRGTGRLTEKALGDFLRGVPGSEVKRGASLLEIEDKISSNKADQHATADVGGDRRGELGKGNGGTLGAAHAAASADAPYGVRVFCWGLAPTPRTETLSKFATMLSVGCDGWALFSSDSVLTQESFRQSGDGIMAAFSLSDEKDFQHTTNAYRTSREATTVYGAWKRLSEMRLNVFGDLEEAVELILPYSEDWKDKALQLMLDEVTASGAGAEELGLGDFEAINGGGSPVQLTDDDIPESAFPLRLKYLPKTRMRPYDWIVRVEPGTYLRPHGLNRALSRYTSSPAYGGGQLVRLALPNNPGTAYLVAIPQKTMRVAFHMRFDNPPMTGCDVLLSGYNDYSWLDDQALKKSEETCARNLRKVLPSFAVHTQLLDDSGHSMSATGDCSEKGLITCLQLPREPQKVYGDRLAPSCVCPGLAHEGADPAAKWCLSNHFALVYGDCLRQEDDFNAFIYQFHEELPKDPAVLKYFAALKEAEVASSASLAVEAQAAAEDAQAHAEYIARAAAAAEADKKKRQHEEEQQAEEEEKRSLLSALSASTT